MFHVKHFAYTILKLIKIREYRLYIYTLLKSNYFMLIISFLIAKTAACVLSETPIFLNIFET